MHRYKIVEKIDRDDRQELSLDLVRETRSEVKEPEVAKPRE